MSKNPDATIPVVVELAGPLVSLIAPEPAAQIKSLVDSGLAELLSELGLDGCAMVELSPGHSPRSIRLRVHGRNQPFSPELMRRSWVAVAPPELWELPRSTGETQSRTFPDGWLAAYVEQTLAHEENLDWGVAIDFVARLVVEAIRQRPGCLIGPRQAMAYLRNGRGDEKSALGDDSLPVVSVVLVALLNLGIAVRQRSELLAMIGSGYKRGRSTEDIVETAYAQLRPSRIEIHIHPEDLEALIPGAPLGAPFSVHAASIDDRFKESFRMMADGLFYQLGVRAPWLDWVPNREMRQGTLAVKIGDLRQPPQSLLPVGKLLVNQEVDRLLELGVEAQPAVNPANGNEIAVVDESSAEAIEAAGLLSWDRLEHVVLILYGELSRHCFRLVDANEVEYLLAQLEQAFPELVLVTMENCSVEDITRVLRSLVQEGISIRNLRAILERLLQYDALGVDASNLILFDDRLALPEDTAEMLKDRWPSYREFVRSGLKYPITQKYAGGGSLTVYLLHPELEAEIATLTAKGSSSPGEVGFDDAEAEAIRDAVWAEVVGGDSPSPRSVILTRWDARAPLREILAPEFPGLAVLTYTELRPDQNIQPIARISHPAPRPGFA